MYSWRVDSQVKEGLEAAARAEHTSVAALLTRIVQDWLRQGDDTSEDGRVQQRIRETAEPYLGSLSGGDPARASEASQRAREIIRKKHGRRAD